MQSLRRAASRLLTSPAPVSLPRRTRAPWLSPSTLTGYKSIRPIYSSQPHVPPFQRKAEAQTRRLNAEADAEASEERMIEAAMQYTEGEKSGNDTASTEATNSEENATESSSGSGKSSSPVTSESEAEAEPAPEPETRPAEVQESQTGAGDAAPSSSSDAEEYLPVPPDRESLAARRQRLLKKDIPPRETVFIGNLFYDVTAEDLRRQMEKYGIVDRVWVAFDNRGISKGFAYVQFSHVEEATRAIHAMHMNIYEGRRVNLEYAMSNLHDYNRQPTRQPTRTLYVGNLPFDLTDRDLNRLFQQVPNVIDVRVSMDRRTGQLKGFVHAEFLNKASAINGYQILQNTTINGRMLRLDYSVSIRRGEKPGEKPE